MESGSKLTDVAKRLDAAVIAFGRDLGVKNREWKDSVGECEPNSAEAEELIRRFKDLDALNRDLESFIGTIAHDLRTPLRSIVGTSHVLLDDFGVELPEEAQDLLRRQVEAGKWMSSLVNDLVEYTRLGQGPQEKMELDLTLMAQDVSYELAERRWSHSIEFKISPGMRVVGYPGLVRIVLQSLIENAVEFTTRTHDASVEVGCMEGPRERIYFVRDNGPGFPQDVAGQIFEPFVRLQGPEVPGNGIGLANARKAVLRHGGRVWAESGPGLGATFFFTLG